MELLLRFVQQGESGVQGKLSNIQFFEFTGTFVLNFHMYMIFIGFFNETNVKTAFEYDLAGNLRFLTNPRGFKAELRYDAANRRTEVIGGSVWDGAIHVFRSEYLLFACLLMLLHNLTSTFLFNGLAVLVGRGVCCGDRR